jgi:hypothetical protein
MPQTHCDEWDRRGFLLHVRLTPNLVVERHPDVHLILDLRLRLWVPERTV